MFSRASSEEPRAIEGTYQNGELLKLTVDDRNAFLIRPTAKVDPQKRWIWTAPFWLLVARKLPLGRCCASLNVGELPVPVYCQSSFAVDPLIV